MNFYLGRTLEGFKDVNAKINALVDSQIKLNSAQSRTDESLKNLIAVVDRYFREGAMASNSFPECLNPTTAS